MPSSVTPAERIAGDLALAIHRGLIRPGEKLPSQSKLKDSYGVAMATASSALGKLAAAGLAYSVPGSGTFAQRTDRLFDRPPVLDVLAASALCRHLASLSFGPDTDVPTVPVGGSPGWDDPHADPEKVLAPRQVDVSALAGLDRHILRWMSEAFLTAARRLVGAGQTDADVHLVESARSILRDGGRRPEGQPGMAYYGGPCPEDEDVALRIWPERKRGAERPADPTDPWGGRYSNEPPF
ncbi:GntR family transcriptional regulator [Streptomyces sp. NPDC018019]|uniref:GntR family transcriptional regulator n=1 Tax=Streptomyces sp. NPDC018019 TaxID=3365030 RepID=UPI0037BB27F5